MQQPAEKSFNEPQTQDKSKAEDWKEVANKFLAGLEPEATIPKAVGKRIDEYASTLVEKDSAEFYKTLAQDKRMEKFLPQLAIAAMRGDNYDKEGSKSELADKLDTNHNNEITTDELLAASKSSQFNPLAQKALSFSIEHFDTLRNLDPKDMKSGDMENSNSSNISKSDLQQGKKLVDELKGSTWRIAYGNKLVQEFDKIDQDKSGKINSKETANWLADKIRQQYKKTHNAEFPANQPIMLPQPFVEVMPKPTGSTGGEELTEQQLQQRTEKEEKRLADFKRLWMTDKK